MPGKNKRDDKEPRKSEVLPAKEADYDDRLGPVARRTGDFLPDRTGIRVPGTVVVVGLVVAVTVVFNKVLGIDAVQAILWSLVVVISVIVATDYPKLAGAVMRTIRRLMSNR